MKSAFKSREAQDWGNFDYAVCAKESISSCDM